MTGSFKWLVSITCVVVIVASGGWLWSQYEQRQAAERAAQASSERATDRAECQLAVQTFHELTNNRTSPRFRDAEDTANRCVAAGLLPDRYWLQRP
jgi:hypothetical protein